MGFTRNLLHSLLIGTLTYFIIIGANAAGISLFSGLLSDFGIIAWLTVVFTDLSVARL